MTILTNKKLMISFSSIGRLLSHVPALKTPGWFIFVLLLLLIFAKTNQAKFNTLSYNSYITKEMGERRSLGVEKGETALSLEDPFEENDNVLQK